MVDAGVVNLQVSYLVQQTLGGVRFKPSCLKLKIEGEGLQQCNNMQEDDSKQGNFLTGVLMSSSLYHKNQAF